MNNSDNKPTTSILAQTLERYVQIEAELKPLRALEKERDALKALIVGSTDVNEPGFMVKITKSTQTRLVGLDDIKDRSKKLWQALFDAGCVKETPTVRLTVNRTDALGGQKDGLIQEQIQREPSQK